LVRRPINPPNATGQQWDVNGISCIFGALSFENQNPSSRGVPQEKEMRLSLSALAAFSLVCTIAQGTFVLLCIRSATYFCK
jgi:hypothetical protein